MTARRYPLEPLAEALHIELGRTGRHDDEDDDTPHGWDALAEQLGTTVGKLRWANDPRNPNPGFDYWTADSLACSIDRYAADIWPEWDDDTPDEPAAVTMFDPFEHDQAA